MLSPLIESILIGGALRVAIDDRSAIAEHDFTVLPPISVHRSMSGDAHVVKVLLAVVAIAALVSQANPIFDSTSTHSFSPCR